ncbi:MAG: HAD family phosphatase [Chloroflexia bacterium]|nr:HAD family phosphatase [Chloroflexia bacterium]
MQAVIFDFGGVLVRTEDLSCRRRWESRLDLPDWGLERLVLGSEISTQAQRGQATEQEVWEYVARTCRLDPQELAELQRDFWSGDRLDPVLAQFLRELRPRYKTAILSNAWPQARQVFVQKYGLGELVDLIVISAEEGLLKPGRRIYERTVQRLGVQPAQAIFVDDNPDNAAGAQRVGLRAVHFKNTEQALAEVRAHLGEGQTASEGTN